MNLEGSPADDASRGLTVDFIISKNRWRNGPDFLWEPESRWPVQPVTQMSDDDPEIKRESQALLSLTNAGSICISYVLQYFSSWYGLKKFVAWILCYREKLKQSSKRRSKEGLALVQDSPGERSYDPLSVDEINKTEKEILKFIQRQSFGEELSRLDEQEEVNESNDLKSAKERKPQIKKSSAIYRFDPMKLGGLLYVGGRLREASSPYPAKHQIILPNKSHVVDLIVRYYHLMSGHSGLEHVLSMVRGKYWILKARTAVRRVLIDCKRRKAPLGKQKMADLPTDQVTPVKAPFTFVGIDCFGLFLGRRGRSLGKRYGVLFTCLSIRAIHLEVSQSLDTNSFINAMRRFIARRGQPEEVRSDNGGKFVPGEKELREAIEGWNQHKIGEFLLQQNVKWTLNPPGRSHHGGVWERCKRTVRKVMSGLTKEQILDEEGLVT